MDQQVVMPMAKTGWFDAFREHGAPTWYGDNRTPVVTDTTTMLICMSFTVAFVAFLVILPGLRKHRLTSFASFVITLASGAVLFLVIHHPNWHVGSVAIDAPFRAHTSCKLDGIVGVRVGLTYVNVTLESNEDSHGEKGHMHSMNYNERFYLDKISSMDEQLAKGLPYPILTVVEYLSVDRAGFAWGRLYRSAGYYTGAMLYVCVTVWAVTVAMLCLVPVYFSRLVITLGACIWSANAIYVICLPADLAIVFPHAVESIGNFETQPALTFSLSWCYWLTLATGGLCLLYGTIIRVIELKYTNYNFTTFLQADYSTRRRLGGGHSTNTLTTTSSRYGASSTRSSQHHRAVFDTDGSMQQVVGQAPLVAVGVLPAEHRRRSILKRAASPKLVPSLAPVDELGMKELPPLYDDGSFKGSSSYDSLADTSSSMGTPPLDRRPSLSSLSNTSMNGTSFVLEHTLPVTAEEVARQQMKGNTSMSSLLQSPKLRRRETDNMDVSRYKF